MARLCPRVLLLLLLGGLGATLAAVAASEAICGDVGGPSAESCTAKPPRPSAPAQDHLLLQTHASPASQVLSKAPETSKADTDKEKAQEQVEGIEGPDEGVPEGLQSPEEETPEVMKGQEEEFEYEEDEEIGDELEAMVSGDVCSSVRRRRLLGFMTSCRRRHATAGLPDSDNPASAWKCNENLNVMTCDPSAVPSDGVLGYPTTNSVKANGLWCQINIPPWNWALKSCPYSWASSSRTTVKVLTYNLFWWRLFNQLGGGDRSVGKLIASTSGPEQYDLMAFQECDDRDRVLRDAALSGLWGSYRAIDGGRAMAIAYRTSRWTLLGSGTHDVGEDNEHQYYGKRGAHWVRLRHRSGKTVFFMNHHGPLPVSWGGGCTGSATSLNILQVIATHAHTGDAIILTGDFNAHAASSRIKEMDKHLHRAYTGTAMGGVDHFFTNCGNHVVGKNLGKGVGKYGSDHDALSLTMYL